MSMSRLTDRARAVCEGATRQANEEGRSVSTADLLVSLIKTEGGIAHRLLAEACHGSDAIVGLRTNCSGEPDLSLDTVVEDALRYAALLKHRYAGTEHLLLVLCSTNESYASRILTSMAIDPLETAHEVFEILGQDDVWEEWISK